MREPTNSEVGRLGGPPDRIVRTSLRPAASWLGGASSARLSRSLRTLAHRPKNRCGFGPWLALALLVGCTGLLCSRLPAQAPAPSLALPVQPRAAWARLITPSPFWSLHSEQDARIARFLANDTGMALDPTPYAVNPASLPELVEFPFIFTNGLADITDPQTRANLREYLQRGGFFYIEGCLDHRMNRNFGVFMALHVALFRELFPDLVVRQFKAEHPVFRSHFTVAEKDLAPIEPAPDDLRWKNMPQALYGFYHQDRLIAIVSLDHLQCEWFTKPEKIPHCLRQIANIYAYAMTR